MMVTMGVVMITLRMVVTTVVRMKVMMMLRSGGGGYSRDADDVVVTMVMRITNTVCQFEMQLWTLRPQLLCEDTGEIHSEKLTSMRLIFY